MTPEQILFQAVASDFPVLAVMCIIGAFVWRELKTFLTERDNVWQTFMKEREADCQKWNDTQASSARAHQEQMGKIIADVVTRVEKIAEVVDVRLTDVEGNTARMAAQFDTVVGMLVKGKSPTTPLKPPDDRKRL